MGIVHSHDLTGRGDGWPSHAWSMATPDEKLAKLCRRQFGVFTWAQARAAGLHDSTIQQRIVRGRYRRLLPGVLAEAGAPDTWEARALAALLAVGGEAVLCRASAARVLDLDVPRAATIAILVRTRTFTGLGELAVHRTRRLDEAEDVATVGPLRTTTPARTIADLAGTLEGDGLRRLVSQAVRTKATGATELRATASRLGRFRGKQALGALIDELHPLDRDCRSELETRFLRLMVGAGLPPTAMNHAVTDANGQRRVLDAVWLPQRLPVELDSRSSHGTLLDWHDDLRRENGVVLTGWRSFLRFSWEDVVTRPHQVVAAVRDALAAAEAEAEVDRGCG